VAGCAGQRSHRLTCDWTDAALPPLSLGAGARFRALTRVPTTRLVARAGLCDAFHEIFFFLQLAHHPEIDPAKAAVYLAATSTVGSSGWKSRLAAAAGVVGR